jgi:hypothetical protein
MADTISAVTGLPRGAAEQLLARHGGDANAAVDAFFDPGTVDGGGAVAGREGGGEGGGGGGGGGGGEGDRRSAEAAAPAPGEEPAAEHPAAEHPSDAIERLLSETKAQSEGERGGVLNGGGRMLGGRWTPAASSSSSSSSAPDREIHIAFCLRAILFFEAEPEPASRVRRRGVHTVGSMAGPYDKHRHLHWIGSMVEVHRITDEDKATFKALVADLASNNVPDLPFLRRRRAPGKPRPTISFILHDHRQHDAPAPLPSGPTSSSFAGSGNSLRGNGNQKAQRSRSQSRARRAGKVRQEEKRQRNIFAGGMLAFAMLLPLIFHVGFGVQANLFHAIAGGVLGAVFMRWLTSLDPPPVFTVNRELNVTQLKFRVKGPPRLSFTIEFNPTVHTLKTLHAVVARQLRGGEAEPELEFDLCTSYPRRTLDPDDNETTLAKANLCQDSISIVMR